MSTSTSTSATGMILWKKVGLIGALLVSLWMIQDQPPPSSPTQQQQQQDNIINQSDSGFGVWMALQQHIPSSRIFRALFECNLLLWGAALSLFVWSRTFSVQVIGDLLFQPALGNSSSSNSSRSAGGAYEPIRNQAGDEDDNRDDNHNNDNDNEAAAAAAATQEQDELQGDGGYERDYEDDIEIRVPTAASVANAAMDMLLSILVTLLLYTISAAGYFSSSSSSYWKLLSHVAAPTFPLLLFAYLTIQAVSPWSQKSGFWILVGITTTAPWHSPVTFRDGFLGDVLTSSVRPLQDIAFTLFYILAGLKGWWTWSPTITTPDFGFADNSPFAFMTSNSTNTNNNNSTSNNFLDRADASVPQMEKSWFYYTVVLPMCLVSPLWWRFLQNLRQCYDSKQRWPFLGNALKYFCAAQVAVVGIFFPSQRGQLWFVCSFVVATLYQIWWDIFMDWQLFERTTTTSKASRKQQRLQQLNNNNSSSSSSWYCLSSWQLRQRRLYKYTSFYWITCILNILLRFGWTLTFLPPRYLDASGVLRGGVLQQQEQEFQHDHHNSSSSASYEHYFNFVLGPVLASAEIVRRTLWGLIRFEWEAIKNYHPPLLSSDHDSDKEDPMDDGPQLKTETSHDKSGDKNNSKNISGQPQAPDQKIQRDDDDDEKQHRRSGSTELTPMLITAQQPTAEQGHSHYYDYYNQHHHNYYSANHDNPWAKYNDMSTMTDGQILGELCLWATTFLLLGGLAAAHRATL